MGRSVSYAPGSEIVLYSYVDSTGDEHLDQINFDDCVDYLQSSLIESFPSMYESDEWVGREDRALTENRLVYVGISEYCGAISVWVKPKTSGYDAYVQTCDSRFARQIVDKLKIIVRNVFGALLSKVGMFSNGESVYIAV